MFPHNNFKNSSSVIVFTVEVKDRGRSINQELQDWKGRMEHEVVSAGTS